MLSCPRCGSTDYKYQNEVRVDVNWNNDKPTEMVDGSSYRCRNSSAGCGKGWIELCDGRQWTTEFGEVK